MANGPYSNFVLANEIEDQYASHLDLTRFATIDNTLEGTAGMKKTVHTYSAVDGVEKLSLGNGNTKTIEAGYASVDYDILLAQGRGAWYDEEAMKDPMIVDTIVRHEATDMFNTVNADMLAEFKKAQLGVTVTNFNFDAFADADAELNVENLDYEKFALLNNKTMAKVRKQCATTLQYNESFARQGYVATVGGFNLYVSKIVPDDMIFCGTREAVTVFNKTGVEVEVDREPNTRQNLLYSRKYYLAALTDLKKVVAIGTAPSTVTTITTKSAGAKTIAGAAQSGSVCHVYINGVYDGSATAASSTYSYTAKENLVANDAITVIAVNGVNAPSKATGVSS